MESIEKRIPVSVYAEATPNPATMRFVTNRALVPEGRLMEFTSPEEAEAVSPLAAKVFNLPFVTGVFISGNFLSVTKNDSIGWDMVQIELREYIQEYLNSDGRIVLSDAPAQSLADANERAVSHAKPTSKEDEMIISVLENMCVHRWKATAVTSLSNPSRMASSLFPYAVAAAAAPAAW